MSFDISEIYNRSCYPVPAQVVTEWSVGKGFGRTEEYSEGEKANLERDITAIQASALFKPKVEDDKQVILTAGAPGAGKTTLLESIIAKEDIKAPYVDPDAVFLKHNMKNSYQADIDSSLTSLHSLVRFVKEYTPGPISSLVNVVINAVRSTGVFNLIPSKLTFIDEKSIRKAAYDTWRPASNFLTHIHIADYVAKGSSFIFGTTSSSEQMASTFEYFKDKGYDIRLIHVSAPDEVRVASIKLRDKEFVQTTDEDIREKGNLVPERINDTYMRYADAIEFHYRDKAEGDAVHAATWIYLQGLTIHNKEAYQAVIELNKAKSSETEWPAELEISEVQA